VLTAVGAAIRMVYEREVTRGDRLEGSLTRMTEAFELLTDEIRRDREHRHE
jgi:hypothetical protein